MIQLAKEKHIKGIFELFKKTYKNHSILSEGEEGYLNSIKNGEYIGLIYNEGNKIIGHAGISLNKNFGIINCLVTDKNFRGRGIGKNLFRTREKICENLNLDFIIGYSMMQHPYSQILYSDSFFPIGMIINYPNIYSFDDKEFNKGTSNAEMVLCRKLRNETIHLKAPQLEPKSDLYTKILNNMDIIPYFTEEKIFSKSIFLGLAPNIKKGLFVFEFLDPKIEVDFSQMITTTPKRGTYKNEIKQIYEKSNIL